MLIYEKKVDGVRHLFGTMENIPNESDNQLVYQDEYGDAVTLTDALENQYFDDGKGGITMVTPEGVSSFLGVAVKDTNNQVTVVIPQGGFTPEEKEVKSIAVDTPPTKVSYTAGEALSMAGLKIEVTYTNNSTEILASNATGITYSPASGTTLTVENTKVTITYKEKTCEQAITVTAQTDGEG